MDLSHLNQQQRIAVTSQESIILVNAGPGTGKTHTLVQRLRYRHFTNTASPDKMLVTTFSTKAARELLTRLDSIFSTQMPHVQTIHAFALWICNQHSNATLIDPTTAKQLAQEIINELALKDTTPDQLLISIAAQKRSQKEARTSAFQLYQQYLTAQSLMDFDDVLIVATTLLTKHADIYADYYAELYVDEFQDLNILQQQLIFRLQTITNSSLFVIGDPFQAIYGFQGAHSTGFNDMQTRFPSVHVLSLEHNYRSAQKIIDTAQSLFVAPHQPAEQTAITDETMSNITLTKTHSETAEATYIFKKIHALIGGVRRQDYDTGDIDSATLGAYTFEDIAILVRKRSQTAPMKKALTQSGIPCTIAMGLELHVDTIKTVTEKIHMIAENDFPFDYNLVTYVQGLLEDPAITPEARDFIIKEARILQSGNFFTDLHNLYNLLLLLTQETNAATISHKVSIMTIHASKGLEFPVVFIPGIEEGIIPTTRDTSDIEEERRLLYVAMTRAQKEVHFSYAGKRLIFGKREKQCISRFLDDMDKKHIQIQTVEKKRRKKPLQRSLF